MSRLAAWAAAPVGVARVDADPLAALDSLVPVGLAELNEAAALMTRTDRKYVVPAADLDPLLAGCAATVLTIAGRRAMEYESTYFDTPERVSYRGAARGLRRRFKVRTRTYLDSGERWLEVKTRGTRELTVKRRIPYLVENQQTLTSEARSFIRAELVSGGVHAVDVDRLQESLTTYYLRSTLLLATERARVTVDQGLRWRSRHGGASAGPVVVIETKTGGGAPSSMDRTLWSAGYRPVRLSKYATGMRILDQHLPGNRWHRVLTRELSGSDAAGALTCR